MEGEVAVLERCWARRQPDVPPWRGQYRIVCGGGKRESVPPTMMKSYVGEDMVQAELLGLCYELGSTVLSISPTTTSSSSIFELPHSVPTDIYIYMSLMYT
jgi:hypothetical protein